MWSFTLMAAAEAAAEAAQSPIQVNLSTFVLQALNVLVVMALLYVLLFKPLGEVMRRREESVKDSLDRAAGARQEAERLLAEYKRQVEGAQQEARAIIDKAVKEAEALRQRRVAETEQEAQKMLDRAKAEIAQEREKAIAALRDEAVTLAMLAAGRVLERSVTEEDHRRLAHEFVQRVGELQ